MAANERRRLLRVASARASQPEPPDALASLADAAARGERAATRKFLIAIGPHVLRVVRRVLGANHPDLDDVAEECAFAVMEALPSGRGESTVLYFACRVAALTALNARRREATRQRHSQREDGLELEVPSEPAPDAELSAPDSAQIVRELIDSSCASDPESPAPAGDEQRIERIARRVQQGMRVFRISPRVAQTLQSVGLSALIAGVAVTAIELSRWEPHPSKQTASARAHVPDLSHDQRLVPVAPEPASSEAPQQKIPAPDTSAASAASSPPIATKYESASALFADANQARVAGDTQKAIAISELLEATFPNSTEGITTHLSLGVLYLQAGQTERALSEFKTYRHIGSSSLMAEALWGEEQALQRLGRVAEERAVLEELLANYPQSVYVGAAEQRLGALNH
ncbi:MAG TPA: tetratricopeptide repeat protein [Polyangiaceae bacterium]|jgi:Tfp pilus assembly protein PilF|nr:tetratricopeptide repeat protein [Polyangiaceae bacterium]